jgi:putative endonuclease
VGARGDERDVSAAGHHGLMPPRDRPPAGPRGRAGASAEASAATHLAALGWTVLARNVRVGPDEIDLVARTPEPRCELVVVEVRGRSGPAFGSALESVDAPKVRRLYRALAALRRTGHPSVGPGPLMCPFRVDLVTMRRTRSGGWAVESHLRGLEPPG